MVTVVVPLRPSEPERFMNVKRVDALRVSSLAIQRLRKRLEVGQRKLIDDERARREAFNSSWLVRLLPFLKRPTDNIEPTRRGGGDALEISDLEFGLHMLSFDLAQAQQLNHQARKTNGAQVRVGAQTWERLNAYSRASS